MSNNIFCKSIQLILYKSHQVNFPAMSHQPNECSDCRSHQFVTNYREGDIICTNCGLVQQERILVDDVFYNPTSYDENNILQEDFSLSESPVTKIKEVFGSCLTVPTIVEEEASRFLKDILRMYRFKGQPLRAAVACSVYISFNNQTSSIFKRDAKEIYKPLGIDAQVFNKTLRQIYKLLPNIKNSSIQDQSNSSSLIRQIQKSSSIAPYQKWDIAKEVHKLERYKNANNVMLGSPPHVVNVVLIFVACNKLNISLDKALYVEEMKICRATLDKHVKTFVNI